MKKILTILIFVLLFPINSFSEKLDKKIKFHPPETEAEKALDYILRIQNKIFTITRYFSDQEYHDLERFVKISPNDCITEYYNLKNNEDREFCKTIFTQQFIEKADNIIKNCIEENSKNKHAKSSCKSNYSSFSLSYRNSISYFTINKAENVSCIHYMTEVDSSGKKDIKESTDIVYRNSSGKKHHMIKMIKENNIWKIDAYFEWYDWIFKAESKTKKNPLGITLLHDYDWHDKYDYRSIIVPFDLPKITNKSIIEEICK